MAGQKKEVRKLLLTASGGPFFGKTMDELKHVRVKDALVHPTWQMGQKITIDSATMMNKGFEIIEASYLFDVPQSDIEVVVHRESIIHSMVEYIDNSIIAQMSVPDMRSCVAYAVDYPERFDGVSKPLDFFSTPKLTFDRPDTCAFPLLSLAGEAVTAGGAMPAVVNAADEIAVGAFLEEKIGFCDISRTVINTYHRMLDARSATSLDDIIAADRAARAIARELVAK